MSSHLWILLTMFKSDQGGGVGIAKLTSMDRVRAGGCVGRFKMAEETIHFHRA